MKRLQFFVVVMSRLFESFGGILVRSQEISQSKLPCHQITDVAVIKWVDERNLK